MVGARGSEQTIRAGVRHGRRSHPPSVDMMIRGASLWDGRQLQVALALQLSEGRPELERTNQTRPDRSQSMSPARSSPKDSHAAGDLGGDHSVMVLTRRVTRRLWLLALDLNPRASLKN